jgi:hypothetical protein
MSETDRKLLEIVGLSIAKAAALLGRSRQAFYVGLHKTKGYLSTSDLLVLVLDAKRRDAPTLHQLLEFIDTHYSADLTIDRDLLSPSRIGTQQLLLACANSAKILTVLNESETHLERRSILIKALTELLSSKNGSRVDVIVPSRKIEERLAQLVEIPVGQLFIYRRATIDVPTVIVLKKDAVRAFSFSSISVEEINFQDAETLRLEWENIVSAAA